MTFASSRSHSTTCSRKLLTSTRISLLLSLLAAFNGCKRSSSDQEKNQPGQKAAAEIPAPAHSSTGQDASTPALQNQGPASKTASSGPIPLPHSVKAISAGGEIDLSANSEQLLDPSARLEIELPRLKDVRVRLFDPHDRIVACKDILQHGIKTKYVLTPNEPLVPGTRYSLSIDGLFAETPVGGEGEIYQPVRLTLTTAGEKPARPKGSEKTHRRSARK